MRVITHLIDAERAPLSNSAMGCLRVHGELVRRGSGSAAFGVSPMATKSLN